jgi:RNA polymerase sigma factor (TIGR02999 family)
VATTLDSSSSTSPGTIPTEGLRGHAARDLLAVVYDELRRQAQLQLARSGSNQTLQATALVHEAWLRVAGTKDPGWDSRAHFFGAAARAMREILIQGYRRRSTQKRGGDYARVEGAETEAPAHDEIDRLAVDDALRELETRDPQKAEIVLLRFFAGLTMLEIAEVLGLSLTKVEREWRFARSWLQRSLEADKERPGA